MKMFDFAIRMRLWVGIFIGVLLLGYSFSYLLEAPGAAIAGMLVGGGIVATFGYLLLRYEEESKPGPIEGTRKTSPTQDWEGRSPSRLPKLSAVLDFFNQLDARSDSAYRHAVLGRSNGTADRGPIGSNAGWRNTHS